MRNWRLQELLPTLIAENVVSLAEADLVLTLFPVQWWRLGARRGAGRPVRSAAGALKAALLAVAVERAFEATRRRKESRRGTVAKVLGSRLQETAEARAWLAEALAESGRSA